MITQLSIYILSKSNIHIKLLFVFCLIVFNSFGFKLSAQDSIVITGQFLGNTRYSHVVVNKFGVGNLLIASAPIKNEKFRITAPKNMEPGIYRFQYSQTTLNDYIDIIINGMESNIDFTLNVSNENRIPVFTHSNENQLWYNWQAYQDSAITKIQTIASFINIYSGKGETIMKQARTAYNHQVNDYLLKHKTYVNKHGGHWAKKMIDASLHYFPEPLDDVRIQDYYKRLHFWDKVNTTDTSLINTPIYTTLILDYLKYYMNPNMNFSEEESMNGFRKSVDTIILKFSANPMCKKFAIDYLSLGFKEIGNETILQYIDEKYQLQEQCNSMLKDTAVSKRLECYSKLRIGMPAPDIKLWEIGDKSFGIEQLPYDTLILVFWASWCPNCENQLPQLEQFLKTHKGIGVLAVSLDKDTIKYNQAIKAFPSMIHICDYKGWESKISNDYCIAASPTYILLDRQKHIIGKFPSVYKLIDNLTIQVNQN